MVFWQADNLKLAEFRPGIMSYAATGDNLIMVCMQNDPEKEDTGHVHAFDQCGMVIEGRLEMLIGEERKVLGPHDCYFIPANTRHGWKTFDQPVRLLDVCPKQPA